MHSYPQTDVFRSIYPDVDPAQNFPPTLGERTSLALAVGIFMFGGVRGDLIIAGAGLVFVVGCVWALSRKAPRRIRAEARSRFPQQPWVEQPSPLVPVAWFALAVVALLAWWLTPEKFLVWSAAAVAIVAAVVTWFLPVIQRRRAEGDEELEPFEGLDGAF